MSIDAIAKHRIICTKKDKDGGINYARIYNRSTCIYVVHCTCHTLLFVKTCRYITSIWIGRGNLTFFWCFVRTSRMTLRAQRERDALQILRFFHVFMAIRLECMQIDVILWNFSDFVFKSTSAKAESYDSSYWKNSASRWGFLSTLCSIKFF